MKKLKHIGSQIILNELTYSNFDKKVFEDTIHYECMELWELLQKNFWENYDHIKRPKIKMRIYIDFEEFKKADHEDPD